MLFGLNLPAPAGMGVPFQYTQSHVLRTRLEFLRSKHNIQEGTFLTFDALRQTAQCVGRVVRSKTDYGVVVLADDRFGRKDKRSKLPGWVRQFLSDAQLDLSTSNALGAVRGFLRRMAQPVTTVWKSKFYGAFVLNRRVVLHAIDATHAR